MASLRRRAGFTQTDMGEKFRQACREIGSDRKISTKTVSDWETGRHIAKLAADETLAMCQVLQCTLEELAEAAQAVRQHQTEAS